MSRSRITLIFLAWYAIGAFMLCAAAWLLCGCSHPSASSTHTATIVSVEGTADLATLRTQYQEVADCWGITPEAWQSVSVRIMAPGGTDASGAQWFRSAACEEALRQNGLWPEYSACYGCTTRDYYPLEIQVPPDLKAFRHEVSHIMMPKAKHGENKECWL